MTTSIRTTWGDIQLNDGILSFYYEAFKNAPDEDACYEAVRDYIISYVDERLPDNLTWFPALSEVYVEIDGDPEGYQDQDDDRSVDDLITDLVDEAMAKADFMLTEDPNAFGRATPLTEYEELRAPAADSSAAGVKARGQQKKEDLKMNANTMRYMVRDWLADEGYIQDDSGIYCRERTANAFWTDWQDVVVRETIELDGEPFCEDDKWFQACHDEEGRDYLLTENDGNIYYG